MAHSWSRFRHRYARACFHSSYREWPPYSFGCVHFGELRESCPLPSAARTGRLNARSFPGISRRPLRIAAHLFSTPIHAAARSCTRTRSRRVRRCNSRPSVPAEKWERSLHRRLQPPLLLRQFMFVCLHTFAYFPPLTRSPRLSLSSLRCRFHDLSHSPRRWESGWRIRFDFLRPAPGTGRRRWFPRDPGRFVVDTYGTLHAAPYPSANLFFSVVCKL